jgi:uncharacterized membrane protein
LLVAACGLVAGIATGLFARWEVAVLVAWDVTGALLVASVWLSVGRFDARATQSHATREDNTRLGTGFLLLSAAVASLGGVALALGRAGNSHGASKLALTIVAIATVASSWAVVHTVFALRYAHEYYTEPIGGIDFKTSLERPDYHDFAYVAFTIGMTFQVSDTDIQYRRLRHSVLRHALLSFLFGAVILAVVVNVVASLLQN